MAFSLQWSQPMSREQLAIINAGCEYRVEKKCTPGLIPIGDVPYCEAVFGAQPEVKDFYPEFLRRFWHRNVKYRVTFTMMTSRLDRPLFFKDPMSWKGDFQSRVYNAGEMPPMTRTTPYVSEVVEFVDEWRYYVADGRIVTSGWYQGENEDAAAPTLAVDWPQGFSGAVDFGTLRDGRLALVEAHAPFVCGWYGDDPKLYAEWQRIAWENADFWKVAK